jgi:hypothetical protein
MTDKPIRSLVFVGPLEYGQVALRRAELFERAGWSVRRVNTAAISRQYNILDRRLAQTYFTGPVIAALDHAIAFATADLPKGAIVFFDKPIYVRPSTIVRLNRQGLKTVSYMPDDPFGPRRDGVWRLFRQCLPLFDLHIVPRTASIEDFNRRGAKHTVKVSFSFDPHAHFPPPAGGLEQGREFSYIGSPHERRPEFLAELHRRLTAKGVPLSIAGPNWDHRRHRQYRKAFHAGPALWGEDYRNAIWHSKASLAFLTRLNRDEISHKAIEIAACGRPPVLEPSPEHQKLLKDGESAIFFSNISECADKLEFYWSRPEVLYMMGLEAAKAVRLADQSEERIVRVLELFASDA